MLAQSTSHEPGRDGIEWPETRHNTCCGIRDSYADFEGNQSSVQRTLLKDDAGLGEILLSVLNTGRASCAIKTIEPML